MKDTSEGAATESLLAAKSCSTTEAGHQINAMLQLRLFRPIGHRSRKRLTRGAPKGAG
jgi:hypothetical protein